MNNIANPSQMTGCCTMWGKLVRSVSRCFFAGIVLQEGQCGGSKLDNRVAPPKALYSPQYGEYSALGYESVIDLLDGEGLIDRAHVGLQGHSATAWQVVYAVAHAKPGHRYAAVVSTGWGDLGYFNYLAKLARASMERRGQRRAACGRSIRNISAKCLAF